MSCPSATLVVWTSAWWHGAAAADDVLDALQAWTGTHRVTAADTATAEALELPPPGDAPASPALLLAALRRVGVTGAGMVLPVAGDVRGLGGPGPCCDAALAAGEAVIFTEARLGIVPRRSGHDEIDWTVYPLAESPQLEQIPIGEAEHELAGAMRAAATALVELDVTRHRPNVRAEIDELVAAQPRLPWPPGMPSRALRVLQRAGEVAAILEVAAGDAPGGALSASASTLRTRALAPLTHAVRFARFAAVNEAVKMFANHASKS